MLQKKNNIFIFLPIIILFLLDLLTKNLFTNKTYFENALICINYTSNYGSSFGIFSNVNYYSALILLISLIFIGILLYNHKSFTKNKTLTLFFIFIIAGILGNSFDRLFFGYVRDFIEIKNMFIFNLADFYITTSFILIIINEIFKKKQ